MKLYRHPFIQTLVFRKDETCHFFVSLFNKDTFEFFPFFRVCLGNHYAIALGWLSLIIVLAYTPKWRQNLYCRYFPKDSKNLSTENKEEYNDEQV